MRKYLKRMSLEPFRLNLGVFFRQVCCCVFVQSPAQRNQAGASGYSRHANNDKSSSWTEHVAFKMHDPLLRHQNGCRRMLALPVL